MNFDEKYCLVDEEFLKTDGLFTTFIGSCIRNADNRECFLKRIAYEYAEQPRERSLITEYRNQFRSEQKALRLLADCPGIVRLYDYFETEEASLFVLERMEGVTLRDFVDQNGYLPADRVLDLACQIAFVYMNIHQKRIIHRDLSANNIFLNGEEITVIDFGLAFHNTGHVGFGEGTPGYMPPEAMQRGIRPTPAYDVYSFGVLLHFLATGKEHAATDKGSDTALLRLMTACTFPNPAQRPSFTKIYHELKQRGHRRGCIS